MCAAITRWVEYNITSSGVAGDGNGQEGLGTRGYSLASSSVGDTFSVAAGNNRLTFAIDGASDFVILTSGTNLDPRFIARDISEKIHNLGKNNDGFDQAQCYWENNAFKLYSGTCGTGSSAVVTSGTSSAHLNLGYGVPTEAAGLVHSFKTAPGNAYNSGTKGLTISGTYNGFFDETYRIVMNKEVSIIAPSKGGTNNYLGTISTGGVYNSSTGNNVTYTISINAGNGTSMGAGTGFVPTMSWTTTGNVDNGGPVELLYSDYFYNLGTKGLMVKFTEGVFNTCGPAWTIVCNQVQYVEGSSTQAGAGTAKYVWGSNRGDDAASAITASETSFTQLGSRGLYIKFIGSGNFTVGDEFWVVCTPPQPQSYVVDNLSYGNVTVSTESPVKCVLFEIMSGAVEISTVKFGLQSNGSFTHHNENNSDTKFRFGTVGPRNNAGTAPRNGLEWRTSVTAADITGASPPTYLYAIDENLAAVSDADNSESIGASNVMGMMADPIFLNVKLGTSEVGANSTINYRVYFDYS